MVLSASPKWSNRPRQRELLTNALRPNHGVQLSLVDLSCGEAEQRSDFHCIGTSLCVMELFSRLNDAEDRAIRALMVEQGIENGLRQWNLIGDLLERSSENGVEQ